MLSVIPPDNSLSGQSVTVTATIVNKGGAATKADASWYDEILISPTNVFDETTAKSLDKIYHQGGLGKMSNIQYLLRLRFLRALVEIITFCKDKYV